MELHDWQSQFEAQLADNHSGQDATHDIFHFRCVWMMVQELGTNTPVDWLVVLTAYYFRSFVSLSKNHPERHCLLVLAALETRRVLMRDFSDFPRQRLSAMCHALGVHSFDTKAAPETLEAKIVQDADRLEVLGAIGLARVFAVSGTLRVSPFNVEDPFVRKRSLDDKQYVLDYFRTKLLTLSLTVQIERRRYLA